MLLFIFLSFFFEFMCASSVCVTHTKNWPPAAAAVALALVCFSAKMQYPPSDNTYSAGIWEQGDNTMRFGATEQCMSFLDV